jgi:hypothetical protein
VRARAGQSAEYVSWSVVAHREHIIAHRRSMRSSSGPPTAPIRRATDNQPRIGAQLETSGAVLRSRW